MELLMDQLDKRREKKQAPGGRGGDTAGRGEHATRQGMILRRLPHKSLSDTRYNIRYNGARKNAGKKIQTGRRYRETLPERPAPVWGCSHPGKNLIGNQRGRIPGNHETAESNHSMNASLFLDTNGISRASIIRYQDPDTRSTSEFRCRNFPDSLVLAEMIIERKCTVQPESGHQGKGSCIHIRKILVRIISNDLPGLRFILF